jgi:hypothetical protein
MGVKGKGELFNSKVSEGNERTSMYVHASGDQRKIEDVVAEGNGRRSS